MRRFFTILLAALVLLASRPAWAADGDELFKAIPDDALGIVVVNRLADTTQKIEAVGATLNIPVPSLLPMLKITTGVGDGINDRWAVGLAAMPQEDADLPPAPLVFVPVSDFAKLVATLMPDDAKAEIVSGSVAGRRVLVTQKGSYAIFAEPSEEDVLKRVKEAKTNLVDEVKPLGDWLQKNDVVVLALPKGVRKAVDAIQQGIGKAKEGLPVDRDELKPALAMFDLFDRSSRSIKEELTHVGIGLRISEEEDFLVSGQAAFKTGGKLSKTIAEANWPKTGGLNNLPADDFVIAGSMVLPPNWSEGLMQASLSMAKLGANSPTNRLSEKQLEKMFKLSQKSMQGLEGMAMLLGTPDEDDASLFSGTTALMYVDNAEKYLKNYRDTLKALADLAKEEPDAPLPKYEFAEIEVAGEKGFEVKMDLSEALLKQAQGNPAVQEMMSKMMEAFYGPEGKVTVYLAPANKQTIAMTYSDKESLDELVQAIKKREPGLGQDEDVATSDKLLPAGTAWKMYISPAGAVFLANWALDKVGQQITLPDFPDTPPLAMGVNFTATGVEARLAFPSGFLDEVGEYVMQVRQAFGR